MTVDLSIVLVNWNTRAITLSCLESVFAQTTHLATEVILVDNASSDGSVAAIRAQYPEITIIENRANVGFARANNQAIRQAKGRYVALLNTDTVVLDAALEQLVAYLAHHPHVGIAAPRLLNADGSFQYSCARLPTLRSNIDEYFLRRYSAYYPRERHLQTFEVESAIGACLVIRAEVFATIGLLDEGFFMNCEDLDFCLRARKAGFVIVYVGPVAITHLGGASMKRARFRMDMELVKTRMRFYRKHHGLLPSLAACAILVSGGLVQYGAARILRPLKRSLVRTRITSS